MTEYQLRKRNLPYKILALKEIARRLLSSKNYSFLLKHTLEIKRIKNHEWYDEKNYNPSSGTYNRFYKHFIIRTVNDNLLERNPIYVWVHEFSHMIWHRDNRIRKGRSRVHSKSFKNLEKRLWEKYREEVRSDLPKIIERCKQKEEHYREIKRAKEIKKEQSKIQKNSVGYKLKKVRDLKKKWETKRKRAETALKKLNRKEKLYITLIKKNSAN